MSIGTRVKILRQYLNMNQRDFAKRLGVSQGAVGMWENEQRNISESVVMLICSEYNVNEVWLRTGEGEMFSESLKDLMDEVAATYNLNDFAKNLIASLLDLPEDQFNLIQSFMESIVNPASKELSSFDTDTFPPPATILIPILGNVAAGTPIEILDDTGIGHVQVKSHVHADFALYIKGNSMEPNIKDGDAVLIRKQDTLENDQIGVFYINGDNSCKVYHRNDDGSVELRSINPAYDPIRFTDGDEVHIIGKVVFEK